MKILESKFVKGFIKMADDGYQQGWHERNGGNLSYRLKPEEVEMIKPRLNAPGEWEEIGVEVPGLAGDSLLYTPVCLYDLWFCFWFIIFLCGFSLFMSALYIVLCGL